MKRGAFSLRMQFSTSNLVLFAGLIVFAAAATPAQKTSASKFTVKPLALPGADGLVMLDYLGYDRTSRRLWVPAGNTGSVICACEVKEKEWT